MTKEKAKELVLMKWEWLSKHSDPELYEEGNNKRVAHVYPELKLFTACCAYCEKYYLTFEFKEYCGACPINKKGAKYTCHWPESPYDNWGKNRTTENAKKMLEFLKTT